MVSVGFMINVKEGLPVPSISAAAPTFANSVSGGR